MELTKEQISYLMENYEISEKDIRECLAMIATKLKEKGIGSFVDDTMYSCLDYCCSQMATRDVALERHAEEGTTADYDHLLTDDEIIEMGVQRFFEYVLDSAIGESDDYSEKSFS